MLTQLYFILEKPKKRRYSFVKCLGRGTHQGSEELDDMVVPGCSWLYSGVFQGTINENYHENIGLSENQTLISLL